MTLHRRLTTCFALSFLLAVVSGCDRPQQNNADTSDTVDAPPQEAPTALEANTKISHLLMGTGSVQGVYFPIGGVICRLLNRNKHLHRIRCSLESTGGSIANLRDLREQKFDLVFAQSDWQHHAYNGSSAFTKDGANDDLRAVFALEADPLALLVKEQSEVKNFDDLADRRVSFGYTRSLQHRIIDDYLAAKGWSQKNFKEVRPMSDTRQVRQLCEDKLEAILLLSSSLNDYLKDLEPECSVRMVAIDGEQVNKVIELKPYYRKGRVKPGMSTAVDKEVMSFGLGAVAVASKDTSPKAIYHIVKEVAENFNDFKSLHPSLAALDKRELPYAGVSIPLHPGAVRYYREARLLKR